MHGLLLEHQNLYNNAAEAFKRYIINQTRKETIDVE
jgi:hypothetical protein